MEKNQQLKIKIIEFYPMTLSLGKMIINEEEEKILFYEEIKNFISEVVPNLIFNINEYVIKVKTPFIILVQQEKFIKLESDFESVEKHTIENIFKNNYKQISSSNSNTFDIDAFFSKFSKKIY